MPSKLSRDRHRLFARRFIEGFTNPYCIEYECAAGECAANLQSVEPFTKAVNRVGSCAGSFLCLVAGLQRLLSSGK